MRYLLLTVLMMLSFCRLAAREQLFFIPGWYSEWINYSQHREILQKSFPDADIRIYKWDSNRLWKNAVASAEICVKSVSKEIVCAPAPQEYILIGHSLGGRIAIKSAHILASKKIKVKRIILLGTAGNPSPEELETLQKVSILPVINIFCMDDNMLKLYIRQEKEFPLGFAGFPRKLPHIRQYRMPVDDHDIRLGKVLLPDTRSMESLRETAAHLAVNYLKYLQTVLTEKIPENCIDYPALEKIAGFRQCPPDSLPGFRKIAGFDSWELSERKFKNRFRLTAPSGKKFYYADRETAEKNYNEIIKLMKTDEKKQK